ncbi:hypothetical protein K2173_013983 [Erythroxylum novogranatense]|uniref:Ribosomal protein S11 n=1 Tax=Erythroxylum novogranatense TaxID=1862640 RepID=A0AAV8SDC9_9ROSI|nr:hypothetical protein K2173_013983 [Erythroxylum novogranatense]
MTKSLQKIKIGSHRNRRMGSHKNPCKVPKGVFYVQASFNNTIVTVTDVRAEVMIKGLGLGRDAELRAIQRYILIYSSIVSMSVFIFLVKSVLRESVSFIF